MYKVIVWFAVDDAKDPKDAMKKLGEALNSKTIVDLDDLLELAYALEVDALQE